jgi:hypothetical protein
MERVRGPTLWAELGLCLNIRTELNEAKKNRKCSSRATSSFISSLTGKDRKKRYQKTKKRGSESKRERRCTVKGKSKKKKANKSTEIIKVICS